MINYHNLSAKFNNQTSFMWCNCVDNSRLYLRIGYVKYNYAAMWFADLWKIADYFIIMVI